MNALTFVILIFSALGAIDRILNNRFGLGAEFERGFMLFGTMALSMIGMIVIAPYIAEACKPVFGIIAETLHIDASVIPALLFANDMGGASLAKEAASNEAIGYFNGLVVAAMMGCTVSFTVPVALGMVEKKHHKELLIGLLCGIVTIPIGSFVAGLVCKIPILTLLVNLLPLVIFSILIAFGLFKFPNACVKIFSAFGYVIKVIITVGLFLAILNFLCGKPIIEGIDTIEEGARICLNSCIFMTGTFPLMYVISKLLSKPLRKLGTAVGINNASALGFISTLATSITTFELVSHMDKRGIVLNSAFAVSAAFTFAGHLAFTMAFNEQMVLPVIVGKLVAGITALAAAAVISKRLGIKSGSKQGEA